MARREYGGSLTDFTTDKAGLIRRGLDAYFWAARTGGTPLVDIQAIGTAGAIAGIKYTSGATGAIDILGPDGYDADGIWVSPSPDPAATRLWLRALDIKGTATGSGGGGGGTVSDATAFAKGILQLAGDLGGGASAPSVVRINGQVPATVATSGAYADLLGKPTIPSAAALAADPAFTGTYTPAAELVERAQDAAAAMFRAGTNVTFAYDDAAGTLTINALGGGSGGTTDPETVRDTIAAALVGGANLSVIVNDAADTITIAVTGLAPVATSGSYADLLSKPTIPTVGAAGAGSGVALASTDASTTNARTPTAHATSHGSGGSDAISPAAIGAEVAGAAATARAFAIARANHTGTQAATTITGLAAVATSGAITDLTGAAADAQLPARLAATALDAAYQQTRPIALNERTGVLKLTKYPAVQIGTLAQVGLSTLYVPWVIRVSDAVFAAYPQYGRWRCYTSTDHDSAGGGIAVGVCDSDADVMTPSAWRWLRFSGSPVMFTEGSSSQTETPCVVWNPATAKFHLYYQAQFGSGSTLVQTTRVATSNDGITGWTIVGDAIPNLPNTVAGYDHTGYARVYYLDGLWAAWHLQGGGTAVSAYGWSFSKDGLRFIADRRRVGASIDSTDGVLRLGISSLVRYGEQVWAMLTASEYISGANASSQFKVMAAPIDLRADLRSFVGRAQPLAWPVTAPETIASSPPTAYATHPDGRLIGAYRINGETGALALAVLS